jgi:hypothetical protein
MARRFGGRFSRGAPDQGPATEAARQALAAERRRVHPVGVKANLLWLPPAVAAALGLFGGPEVLVLSLAAAATLGLGAWLLREGLKAQAAWEERSIARRPALPRKILAAALAGGGAALAALSGGVEAVGAALYGAAAVALHLAAFGLDPLRDKRVAGIDSFQQDRVARVIDEAETHLAAMREQVASLGERALDLRVAGFQALARRMIRTVEEDPRDLTAARKYLGVYLMGARDATQRFAEIYRRTRDAKARADYEALLGDLEANFAERTTRLLEGGREAMDIEIKVLRDRLQREGIRPEG